MAGNSYSHGSREAPRAWERSCWKSPPGVPPIPSPVPTIVSTGLERTNAEAAARRCTSRVPTYVAHI